MSSGETPLSGRRIIVTRARAQASELVDRLSGLGATVTELPAIEIVPTSPNDLDAALRRLAEYHWMLFTSANTVDIVFDRMVQVDICLRRVSGLQIGAIGETTAEHVRQRGGRVDYVPETAVAESLLAGLTARGVAGSRILLPRARVARDILPDGLRSAGAKVDVVVVYETHKPRIDSDVIRQVMSGDVDCVTFTSQSSVRNVLEILGGTLPPGARVACIGPVTAEAARVAGLHVDILASEYSVSGLVDALVTHLGVGRKAGKA